METLGKNIIISTIRIIINGGHANSFYICGDSLALSQGLDAVADDFRHVPV